MLLALIQEVAVRSGVKLLALCLFSGGITPALADDCLSYEPAEVTLTGKLSLAWGYGSPGYGEDPKHDQRELYAKVTLPKAVCVDGGDQDGMDERVEGQKDFQLVPDEKNMGSLRSLNGKIVSVTGPLFHRISGGHTDVMILYKKIMVRK